VLAVRRIGVTGSGPNDARSRTLRGLRQGGEEFLLVLRASASSGVPVVERLLMAWQAREPLASLSAGVAVHRHGQSPSVTYAQADRALYQAKAAGRGQLVLALAEAALP
jgi:diguanylate cyclase